MLKFVLAVLLFSACQVQAATRSYFSPAKEGQRIGTCLANGTSCGKVAADAFCKREGYSESILFAREPAVTTRILDSDAMCEVGCEAFKRVKCYTPQVQAAG